MSLYRKFRDLEASPGRRELDRALDEASALFQ